jgi:hypothetical protein
VDSTSLARSYKLAGGSIRSIVLDAAFLAAAESRSMSARHLRQAAKREYQKMGKVVPDITGIESATLEARAGA